jgi:hypothetical protein
LARDKGTSNVSPHRLSQNGKHDGEQLSNPLIAPAIPATLDDETHYIQKLAYHLYTVATAKFNPTHFQALRQKFLPLHRELIRQAGLPWDGELLSLQHALIDVTEHGLDQCPVSFSEEEKQLVQKEGDEWDSACSDLIDLRNMLGIDVQGWVPNDQFDEVVRENQRLIQAFAEDMNMNRDVIADVWPFRDTQ